MKVQRSFKNQTTYGKLHPVPTSIGNTQDITYRAVGMLKSADFVCAEDTRNTGFLLRHSDISAKQINFHEYNVYEKIPELIALMKEGKILVQVSDAGMLSISDPGHDLVKAAIAEEIPVVAVLGASAEITALITSSLAPQPHIFYGFLPGKAKQQKEFLKAKKQYLETQIFYGSPCRVADTLDNMLAVYGDRKIILVRKLIKLYEEYQRGYISEVLEYIAQNPLKGECLIAVSGQDETVTSEEVPEDINPAELVAQLVEAGDKPNQAIKRITKTYDLNRREVYNAYHQL